MAKFKRKHEDVMEIYEESFKREKIEYKKTLMDIFTKSIGITGKTIMIIVITIYILVLIGVFLSFETTKEQTNQDVGKYLEKQYDCNFVITPKNVDEKGNGIYTAYNKRNKNIVFQITKNKTKMKDTYMKEVIIYYIQNKMTDFNIEDYSIINENEKSVCFNIYDLDELEKNVEFIYELNKRTMKDLKGYSNVTGYVMLRYGEYFYYPYIGTDKSVEEIVQTIKVDYENSKK